MKKLFIATLTLVLTPLLTPAYIIPTRMILQRVAENAGTSTYAVEQEVQFTSGEDTLVLKENWLIENDSTMRLTVTGTKDLQHSFKLQYVYADGQRWSLSGNHRKSNKLSEDFLEKYLNFRSSEALASALIHQDIIPGNTWNKKPSGKTTGDFKYGPESWVRYSRTGGVVNYALGSPTPSEQEQNSPGIWIEQDQFVIRKLRLASHAEMTADNYNQFAKGLVYPRDRTIRWGNNSINIHLVSISAKPKTAANLFQPTSLDTAPKMEGLANLPAKETILEFYSRFR